MRDKALYGVWTMMKQRCLNPKHKLFAYYGGRGIKVCDEWTYSHSFTAFESWAMANGYTQGLTIDRIDNDGDYTPTNCRWVTRSVNLSNRRMTPAWKAALDKMRQSPKCYVMKGKRLAACLSNMAKARANRWPNKLA